MTQKVNHNYHIGC